VFNGVLCTEDESGSGSIAPLILNLNTRWRWVVNFTLRPLYPRRKNPGTHWIGSWVGLRVGLDAVANKGNPCTCRESNPGCSAHSLITVLTDVSEFPAKWKENQKSLTVTGRGYIA
jgi:hypothetical protein